MRYTPLTAFTSADQLTYQLADGRGGVSDGIVAVSVISSNAITLTPATQSILPDGSFTASYLGVPGLTYTVDRATSVAGPWELGFTNTMAATNGTMQFADPNTPALPQRYYRTRYP